MNLLTLIGKWLGSFVLEKVWKAVAKFIKDWYEERQIKKEINIKIKQLKKSKTPEEIRAALRNINL